MKRYPVFLFVFLVICSSLLLAAVRFRALAQNNNPVPTPGIEVRTPRNQRAAELRRLSQEAARLAAEIDPPPLPPMPAHAVNFGNVRTNYFSPPPVMPSPALIQSFRTMHPSGAIIEVTMPTNTVAIIIPDGFYLTNRIVSEISLDEFVDFKRTNGNASVFFFKSQP